VKCALPCTSVKSSLFIQSHQKLNSAFIGGHFSSKDETCGIVVGWTDKWYVCFVLNAEKCLKTYNVLFYDCFYLATTAGEHNFCVVLLLQVFGQDLEVGMLWLVY
jgi:hypothetical protein